MQEKAHTFDLRRAALHVGLAPDSLAQLAERDRVPHEVRGGRLFFAKPELERWRNKLLPRYKVYGHVDGMARDLRDALAKGGDDVELFVCAACARARTENIAVRMCHLCGDAVCAPHSLHHRDGSPSPVEPRVPCDRCYQALPRSPRSATHALPGHATTADGSCSSCCDPYPVQCTCGSWIHAEGGTGWEGADAPVSKGPTCERCGDR
jgi:hypothetical protein